MPCQPEDILKRDSYRPIEWLPRPSKYRLVGLIGQAGVRLVGEGVVPDQIFPAQFGRINMHLARRLIDEARAHYFDLALDEPRELLLRRQDDLLGIPPRKAALPARVCL